MGSSLYLPGSCRIADYRATVSARSGAVVTIKISITDHREIGWLIEELGRAQRELRPTPPPAPRRPKTSGRRELAAGAAPLLLVHRPGDDDDD